MARLPTNQLRQIFGLLLGIGPAADLVDAQVGMRAVAQPDRGGRAADLLAGDEMFEIAEPKPAIRLLNGDAVQAQLAHHRPQFAREAILGIDRGSDRFDPVEREAARRLADRVGHLAEREVQFSHQSLHRLLRPCSRSSVTWKIERRATTS
jgi:hypothetical protein